MIKKIKLFLTFIFIITVFTNCSKVTYQIIDKEINVEPIKVNASFFLYGVFQTENKDVKNICNGKTIYKIQDYYSFLDNVLTIVTLGIYDPKTILVYCN